MSENFSETKNKPSHLVYVVDQGRGDKSHWMQVGSAWKTKDNGLNVYIKAAPISGELVLRDREHLEQMREQRKNNQEQKQEPRMQP